MVVKRFSEYSMGEQRNLLMHWWYYYSKTPYTFVEYNKFRKAVEKDPQVMMNMVFTATINERGNEEILNLMRCGKFDEYWSYMSEFYKSDEFQAMYDAGERFLIEEIVDSYRNPKSRDESVREKILTNVARIIRSNGYELTSERVCSLYDKCIMRDDDFYDDELTGDFTVSEGVNGNTIFMTERLNQFRNDIYECIEMLPGLNRGNAFLKLFKDKNGIKWTDDQSVLDKLIQLGVASELVYFPVPRDSWKNLPNGLPIVAASYMNDKESIVGHSSNEYKKVLEKVNNGTYRKDE